MSSSWSRLLAATARLIDLHDSAHEPGSPFIQVSQESRRGLRDGYWLDLGCLLLDYLLEVDFDANGAFIPQSRCLTRLREEYPALSADDLGFVVNLLSTPSELHFRRGEEGADESPARVSASTKRTAPIERQRQTGQVRLSAAGRQAATLAAQVEDVLYSEYDAAKVLAALDRGDFARVPQICRQILIAIRGLTQELRRVREHPSLTSKLAALTEQHRHYHHALGQIQGTLLSARAKLATAELAARFEHWCEQRPSEQWDLLVLSAAIARVLTAIENLSRRLAELLADIAEGRIQSMGVIDFSALAKRLLLVPPSERLSEAWLGKSMPFDCAASFPRLAPMLAITQREREARSTTTLVFDTEASTDAQDRLLARFLARRAAPLRERIRRAPLSLPEAIEEGWHRLDDEECLAQLVNAFVDTELLGEPLRVGLDASPFAVELADGRLIEGDLTPTLRFAEESPG
ncbi:hypothetical protein [Halotalea alkalilenta]|uniref:hypothetical protein n=1 Tax=Halotalea alkalilenta TaxID=376489 RepID=UPI0005BD4DBB|nr:hypothetical protein [Halotalea alkalilenta]